MKKFWGSLVLMLFLIVTLAACSGDGADSLDDNNDGGGEEAEGKTNISFWHAMSGSNGDELEEIVDKFNDQSDSVHVEAIYQGSYDDSLTKLRAVGGSDEAPAIVQVFEIGTKYMRESGFITRMQDFIDDEDFDRKSTRWNFSHVS